MLAAYSILAVYQYIRRITQRNTEHLYAPSSALRARFFVQIRSELRAEVP